MCLFIYVSVCMSHVCADGLRGQKRAFNFLELGLQLVLSHITWALKLNSSLIQKLQVLLTTEQSLQSPGKAFLFFSLLCDI